MKLIFKKFILFALFLFNGSHSFSQTNRSKPLLKKEGLIVFEGEGNVFDIYFIKTAQSSLNVLFSTTDTVYAISIQTPFNGCVPMDTDDFKRQLERPKSFDSLSYLITQENHLGQSYEDTTNLYYKFGYIKYKKSMSDDFPHKSPSPSVKYKQVHYHDKIKFIAIQPYVQIESFSANAATKNIPGRK